MRSKKVLALMMGAIIASSVTSQTAVQVYAHGEESRNSSYSCDDSNGTNILDEEESSGGAEPMEDSPAVEELEKLTNFKSERTKEVMSYRHEYFDLLYVSTSNLVFELTSDTEVGLACLDAESEFNGNVVVPERVSINGKIYSVTSIGSCAFEKCENLRNVTLPASITRIGSCAFDYCNNLQFEELPESLEIIGAFAFANCENLRLTSLPNGLREICKCAFINCRNLQLESLPEGLTRIGRAAFRSCRNLQLEALPDNLRKIGNDAFTYCENLQLKKLPEGLETIGRETFRSCRNLQLEALPANLREIGDDAFTSCYRLNLRELPANLREIGNNAFAYCGNLPLEELPANLREIGNNAFSCCRNLQLEELPEGLEIIGRDAFSGCNNLQLKALPANLREIGDGAFDYCSNLRLEELPKGITKIGGNAFAGTSIRAITIPASVTELGDSAFDTDSIEEINLAQESRLNNDDIERAYGKQLERIQRLAKEDLHMGQEVIIPVELDAEELEKLTNFKSERTKEVMSYRHEYLDNLYVSTSNLVFEPTSDTEAKLVCLDAESEFNGDVVVPEKVSINGKHYSVTSIASGAFSKCGNLRNVTLPASITRIGGYAFYFCENLQLEALPEGLEIIDENAFSFCERLRLRELPEGLTIIGERAFMGCIALQLESLPNNLREVGIYAFVHCSSLKLETLPLRITRIGECAFANTGIRKVTIPKSVTALGNSAFDTNSIERINLAQGSRLNDGDIIRAYGKQLGRIQMLAALQRRFRIIRERIITPVELNAEDAKNSCSICKRRFNKVKGSVGKLPCGHYIHIDCFEALVKNKLVRRNRTFMCPICKQIYDTLYLK